jgi:hypothetical protein
MLCNLYGITPKRRYVCIYVLCVGINNNAPTKGQMVQVLSWIKLSHLKPEFLEPT